MKVDVPAVLVGLAIGVLAERFFYPAMIDDLTVGMASVALLVFASAFIAGRSA